LCIFYAIVVDFCAKAMKVMDAPGKIKLYEHPLKEAKHREFTGSTLAKALFRPFEKEFGEFENKLRKQNEETRE
jgi:hypothetical protein